MSNRSFTKGFSNKVLESLERDVRRQVQRQAGQLLIIPGPAEIRKAITDTFQGQAVEIKDGTILKMIPKLQENFRYLQIESMALDLYFNSPLW